MADFPLILDSVRKSYGDFNAVKELSLSAPAGCVYGLLGPNGAGKTTTIRMILDIIRPDSGRIEVLGSESALKVRERIGYLPEEKGLYKKMKARAVIAYFASLKGLPRREARARAAALLERYGLADFADKKIEALSKGMGQKVQVLAAIAHDPELVILDEPFSGLDPVNQIVMEEVIRDLASRGRTVLFSTHVMQHAERVCDRLYLIAEGRCLLDGTLEEARRTVPRRVIIETDDDPLALAVLDQVLEVFPVDDDLRRIDPAEAARSLRRRWEVVIREAADAEAVLQACFARGIRLRAWDHAPPSLHEIFVHLVGPGAREALAR